ncbi:MAG TPA: S-adenosylmethionine decarboxylase [Cyclobacteriaceae bacterium]|nr:S-adenosylmethionine decarboxylase [Cyclobacteriaceae bacterium]
MNSPDLRLQAPGCHIISNFETERRDLLNTCGEFKSFIETAIERNQLNKVGEAYHDFEGGGFTAVICLAESHLSIHTWPAQGYVTFDIFLSNFTVDNSPKAKAIYRDVIHFFDANVVFEKNLER